MDSAFRITQPKIEETSIVALPHLCGENHNVWAANLALLLLLLMALPCAGQVPGTRISGSISSPSGDPIANAAITLKNLATNEARSFTANADGSYELKNLGPGRYEVTATAPGYAPASITIDLAGDSGAPANLVLLPLASGGAVKTSGGLASAVLLIRTASAIFR
jgi:Carboxypeptidase regulatory-like domain